MDPLSANSRFNNVKLIARVCMAGFLLFGNSMVFAIYNTKKLRAQSMSTYLSALAVADTILIAFSWTKVFSSYFQQTSLTCKFIWYLMQVFNQFCPLLQCITSFDRLIDVRFAYRFKLKNKFKFKIGVILLGLLISGLTNLPHYLLYDYMKIDNVTWCTFKTMPIASTLTITNLILYNVLPFCFMIACTIAVFVLMKKSKSKFSTKRQDFSREQQMFKTMIGMDCFFFICNAPLNIISPFMKHMPNDVSAVLILIATVLTELHHVLSFVVYIICNKVFRETFIQLVCGKRCDSRSNAYKMNEIKNNPIKVAAPININ